MPDDDPPARPTPSPPCTVRVCQRGLEPARRWPLRFLRQVVRVTLAVASFGEACEVGLTLTGDVEIRQLNASYRDRDEPTDVLSFAQQEGMAMPTPPGQPKLLGDVVVSLDTTERQAHHYGVAPQAEVAWVICHGVLHLLGYDHPTEQERARMRVLETQALERLGLHKELSA